MINFNKNIESEMTRSSHGLGVLSTLRLLKKRIVKLVALTLIPAVFPYLIVGPKLLYALPQGWSVESGTVDFTQDGSTLNINSSDNAIINFNSFNINPGEIVNFIQSSSGSSVLSRVTGGSSSDIFGSLFSNGQLVLINQNGITFHETANVQVGSLIASTLDIQSSLYLQNQFTFEKNNPALFGKIENFGSLSAAEGGHIALLAEQVKNAGSIQAHLGSVVLGAGQKQTLNFDGNGLINLVVDSPLAQAGPDASVANFGMLQADGGKVILSAKTLNDVMDTLINNAGVIQATEASVARDGSVEFVSNGDIRTTGTVKADRVYERGASFHLGGLYEVGLSNVQNLDQAVTLLDATSYSGVITDAQNIIVDTNATITLTGDTTFWADSDASDTGGRGAFTMLSGSTINGGAINNLTIYSGDNASLQTLTNIGQLTLNKSQAGLSTVYEINQNTTSGSAFNMNAGIKMMANNLTLTSTNSGFNMNGYGIDGNGGKNLTISSGAGGTLGPFTDVGTLTLTKSSFGFTPTYTLGQNLTSGVTNITVSGAGNNVTLDGGGFNLQVSGALALSGIFNPGNTGSHSFGSITMSAGTFQQGSATLSIGNLTLNGGTLNTSGGTTNITGDLAFGGAATLDLRGTVNFSGANWTKSADGTLNANTSTVNFTGSGTQNAQMEANFYNLNHTGSGTYNQIMDLTVTNNFSNTNGTFDMTGNGFSVGGNFSNSAIFKLQGTEAISITGSTTETGTWRYDNSAASATTTLRNMTYNNLELVGNGDDIYDITGGGTLTINGGLTIGSGSTLSVGLTENVTFDDATTIVNNGTLMVARTSTLTNLINDADSGLFWLNSGGSDANLGSGDLNVQSFYNLKLSTSGGGLTVHNTGASGLTIAGSMEIDDSQGGMVLFMGDGKATTVAGTVTIEAGAEGYDAGTGTQTLGGLTVSGGAYTASGTGTTDVNGNVLINGGILNADTGSFLVGGDWTRSSGSFNHGNGTITFDKASGTQTVDTGGTAFSSAAHSGAGTMSMASAGSYTNLTNSAGTIRTNGYGLTVAGTFSNTATLELIGSETVSMGANGFDADSGTVVFTGDDDGTDDTFNFDSPGFGGGDPAYYNLIINSRDTNSSGDRDIINVHGGGDSFINVNGDLTVTQGTLSALGGFLTIDGSTVVNGTLIIGSNTATFGDAAGDSLTVGSGGTLQFNGSTSSNALSGSAIANAGSAWSAHNASTIIYNSTGAQSLINKFSSYGNLSFTNTGTYTASNALDVNGNLVLSSTATLDLDTNDVALNTAGNVTFGAGTTFSRGSGLWTADGSGSSTFTSSTASAVSLGDLTVNGTAKSLLLSTDQATLTFGTVTTGADDVFDINGENVSIATLVNNGEFKLRGSETTTLTTYTPGGTWRYVGDGAGGSTFFQIKQIAGGASTDYANLIIDGLVGETFRQPAISGGLVVSGDFQIIGGTYAPQSGSDYIQVAGNTTISANGSFGTGGGALTANTFNNLTVNGGSFTTASNLDINGNLTVTGVGAFTAPSGASTFTLGGNIAVDATADIFGNGGTIILDGTTHTINTGGTDSDHRLATIQIGSGTSTTSMIIGGTSTVTSLVFNAGSTTSLDLNGNTLYYRAASLNLTDLDTLDALDSGSTLQFGTGVTQTLTSAGKTLGNITLGPLGTGNQFILGDDLTMIGNMTINSSFGQLNFNGNDLTLSGNLANMGQLNFSNATGLLTFNGTGTSILSTDMTNGETLNIGNMTISGSAKTVQLSAASTPTFAFGTVLSNIGNTFNANGETATFTSFTQIVPAPQTNTLSDVLPETQKAAEFVQSDQSPAATVLPQSASQEAAAKNAPEAGEAEVEAESFVDNVEVIEEVKPATSAAEAAKDKEEDEKKKEAKTEEKELESEKTSGAQPGSNITPQNKLLADAESSNPSGDNKTFKPVTAKSELEVSEGAVEFNGQMVYDGEKAQARTILDENKNRVSSKTNLNMRGLFVLTKEGLNVKRAKVNETLKDLFFKDPTVDLVKAKQSDKVFMFSQNGRVAQVDTNSFETKSKKVFSDGSSDAILSPDDKKAYVTNALNDTVQVLDMKTMQTQSFPVNGAMPLQATLNASGDTLFVSNTLEGTISKMDTKSGKIVSTFKGGEQPLGIYLSRDEKSLYITDYSKGTLKMMDPKTGEVMGEIEVGKGPYGIGADPKESMLLVTNRNENTVSVIDRASFKESKKIKVGERPMGVTVTPEGTKAYVTNQLSSNMSLIDLKSKDVVETIPTGTAPTQVLIGAHNKNAA